MKMGGRVFSNGAIAATDVAALQADSQMHPILANFQTLLTPFGRSSGHVMDVAEMGAFAHENVYGP